MLVMIEAPAAPALTRAFLLFGSLLAGPGLFKHGVARRVISCVSESQLQSGYLYVHL